MATTTEPTPQKGEQSHHELAHTATIYDDHGDPHGAALEDDIARPMTSQTWLAIFFLGFTFASAIGVSFSVVVPVIAQLGLTLEGSVQNIAWIPSGWTLGITVSFAIAGQLSDIFGRRNVILVGQAILIIGQIVSACANQLGTIIAGMTIGGFGTGICFVAYSGLSEIVQNKYRSVSLAWTELNIAPWSIFGPVLGQAIILNISWRWIFILAAILGVVSMIGTAMFYWPPPRPQSDYDKSRWQELLEQDFLGLGLYSAGLTLFLIGLNFPTIFPWRSAAVLVPLIIGFLLIIAAFIWDFYGPVQRPIFPWNIMKMFREYTLLLL